MTLHTRPAPTPISRMIRLCALALALSLSLTCLLWRPTRCERSRFAIAPGPLDTVLNDYAKRAGISLSFDEAAVAGLHSNGLQGDHGATDGLAHLLQGTGLRISPDSQGGYRVLLPAPGIGGPMELTALSISGKAPGALTEGSGAYTTESSSSSTRLNLSLKDTPQSITVLTRQRLDDQKLDTLTDALDATTGITVIRESLGADSTAYLSRGFAIRNFEIDGVPTSANMDNYTQNTAMYDRVEIVRGATGLISGMGNPSATINLIRKRPTLDPQAQLSAEAGSWDRYGLAIDVSGALDESGRLRGRFVADHKQQHAWIDRYSQELSTLYGITELDLTDATLLTAGLSQQVTHSTAPIRTGFPLFTTDGGRTHFSRSFNTAPRWSYYDRQQSTVFTSLEHQFANGWSGKVEYSHARNDYDTVIAYVDGEIDTATGAGATINPTRWKATPTQDSLDAYLTGTFDALGREHELIGGLTLSRTLERGTSNYGGWQSARTGYADAIDDIFNWNGSSPKPVFTQIGTTDMTETQYAGYLTSRLHLSDAVRLILGARVVDWNRVNKSALYSGSRQRTERTENGVVIPYAGLVYDLSDTWAAYASYTQIFNPQGNQIRDVKGSPLDPQEGTGYEVGLKAELFDKRLSASLALFRVEQDNLAIADGRLLQPNGFQAYRAESGTTSEGVELELNGELAQGWQVMAGYSYNVSFDTDDQRIVTEIPRNSAKLFTTYRLPGEWDKWTVGGGVNWQSETGYALSYATTQSSYALVNLMTRYQVTPALSASVNINNLLDRHYLTTTAGGIYGAPRNVMTTLRYHF